MQYPFVVSGYILLPYTPCARKNTSKRFNISFGIAPFLAPSIAPFLALRIAPFGRIFAAALRIAPFSLILERALRIAPLSLILEQAPSIAPLGDILIAAKLLLFFDICKCFGHNSSFLPHFRAFWADKNHQRQPLSCL